MTLSHTPLLTERPLHSDQFCFPTPIKNAMRALGESTGTHLLSPSSPLPPPRRRTMEEVWKDLGLTSLQDHQPTRAQGGANTDSSRRTILQEFLGRPLRERSLAAADDPPDIGINLFTSSDHLPATALSLSSGPEFQFLDTVGLNQDPLRRRTDPAPFMDGSPSDPFEAIGSSLSKKRGAEPADNTGDRRNKRMIKNRESAARSRARKQAYTNELEMEVAHLIEENAKLRREQQELCIAVASAQVPTKRSLHRTSTAPF